MFGWWGRAVVRARWWVLLVTAVFVTVGALWGTGVFDALAGGGFEVPNSQSSVAARRIGQTFGPLGQDGLVLYTSADATVDEPGWPTRSGPRWAGCRADPRSPRSSRTTSTRTPATSPPTATPPTSRCNCARAARAPRWPT
jgi:RND superfamily putative drug exporter